MRLVYVVGARPNFVKMAPVIAALSRRLPDAAHVLVHTEQHYDYAMSDVFFDQLGLPEPSHRLDVGSATHAVQTARMLERLEPVLEQERPDLVLVAGDVNSTLAATLVAVKLELPLAHVESGLRSFDLSMPEEVNRIVADRFAELLFAHSEEAVENLRNEGVHAGRIHLVGNTMIDSLAAAEPRFRSLKMAERLGLRPREYVLATLHRPALVDGPLLSDALVGLGRIARVLPVVFPVHPRTRAHLEGSEVPDGVLVHEPLPYLEFLSLEAEAAAVVTDSGGVQEETTYLGIRCFTLRDTTDRPVTVRLGTTTMLGLDPAALDRVADALGEPFVPPSSPPPLWDGAAATRIAELVATR
jgi:UDP-N-acetylglucosamine 2-epimerase (non-hydrolysing)